VAPAIAPAKRRMARWVLVPTTLLSSVVVACSSARALSSNRVPLAWAGVGGRSFGLLRAGSHGAFAPRAAPARRCVPVVGRALQAPARCMAAGEPAFTLQERLDAHNEVIEEVYREAAEDFAARPANVEVALEAPAKWWSEVVGPRLDRIADAAKLSPGEWVLDVGVGTGTMIEFLTKEGRAREADVVGIDISEEMLEIASERYPDATFVLGDVLTASLSDLQPGADEEDVEDQAPVEGAADAAAPAEVVPDRPFDAVVLNAVLPTMFDPVLALRAAASHVKRGGRVVVSHPLGAAFVKQLKGSMSDLILHELPNKAGLDKLVQFEALKVVNLVAEEELYIATMEKIPHRVMEEVLYMRGEVATGYGRGGKKLGVPTANLPESLFAESLRDVPAGVYFGWAQVDGVEGGAKKAVVNVGYSPTFVGEENREKIVEAHLLGKVDQDFYGSEMRLLLAGFLRPEAKFASFPLLLAAIKQDLADAEAALDLEPFTKLATHPYLAKDSGLATWMKAGLPASLLMAK